MIDPPTCNDVTLRSSSEMYCSFLTLDLCADCRFAKILINHRTKEQSEQISKN
jgi:hypothetical protein